MVRAGLRRGEDVPEDHFPATLSRAYAPAVLRRAQENWRARMVHEHRSAAVFSGLLPQLMAAGAALDFKTTALRASLDELRHASLCAAVVSLLGGEPSAEAELTPAPLPTHAGCSAREVALRNVLFAGCLSETVSVSLLSAERETTREPAIRRVVEQLAADEVLHARLGWTYLASTLPELSSEGRARLPDFLRASFAHLERSMAEAMPLGPPLDDTTRDELAALGVTASEDGRELFLDTVHAVILPRLEDHGVPAREAWRTRHESAGS